VVLCIVPSYRRDDSVWSRDNSVSCPFYSYHPLNNNNIKIIFYKIKTFEQFYFFYKIQYY
jgi:hypothetical protein